MCERLKRCRKCGEMKPLTEFHRRSEAKDGLQSWCKVCALEYDQANRKAGTRKLGTPGQVRKWNLNSRYGLTPQQVAKMKEKQGMVCAICGEAPERWVVDHNHNTGAVRGMLCHQCNIKLPVVEDLDYRESALAYLSRWT